MNHLQVEHKIGVKKCIAYLGSLGKQNPDIIKMVRQNILRLKNTPSKLKERVQIEEEKMLLTGTSLSRSITCFMCFHYIQIVDNSLDKSITRHTNLKLHNKEIEDWEQALDVSSYPCPNCSCRESTLQTALNHAKKLHNYSPYEYFEFLRSRYAPAPDTNQNTICFICFESVTDMQTHIISDYHMNSEEQWMKEISLVKFPCGFCPSKSFSLFGASSHAFKAHRQPYVEYMQYLEIFTNKKSKAQDELASQSMEGLRRGTRQRSNY